MAWFTLLGLEEVTQGPGCVGAGVATLGDLRPPPGQRPGGLPVGGAGRRAAVHGLLPASVGVSNLPWGEVNTLDIYTKV